MRYAVLPGDVDDVTVPSGGNTYDRRVCQGLAALGQPVREIAVPGTWPQPDATARANLAWSLDALPDGATVLVDGLVACGVPEIVVPRARRLRLAVLLHLPLADETGLPSCLTAELDLRERTVLRAVSAVVTTSTWAAQRVTAHHELDGDRVHVVTPGTDPAPVAPGTDGASRLLCVASVTERKGHDLLVEALAGVADLPWSCVCAGPLGRDPAYVARVRHQISRRGLGDRVRLVGPQAGQGMADAYAAADLLVLPSRAETYGMVLSEAFARGIPVLATSVGGVPGTVRACEGELPGILVPPEDSTALAAALRRWLRQEALRAHLRAMARCRRRALAGWEQTAQRMAAVLDRLGGEPA